MRRHRGVFDALRIRATAGLCVLALAAPGAAQGQDGRPGAVVTAGPRDGETAPDFALPWATADSVGPEAAPFRLSHHRGKVVVLAFYPRDFTSGCTAEMRTFTQEYDRIFGADVVVVGVSVDSLASHVRFARSLGVPFRLLSDPDQTVAARYGSRGTQGTARRTVYVIDREGRVAYRDLRFGAVDRQAYDRLAEAVRAARARPAQH